MLWDSTHRDVHPNPVSYDELTTRATVDAAAVESADPTAQIVGPSDSITLIVVPPLLLPSINSLSPANGPMAGGTAVTIHGANFVAGSTVTFGSAAPVAAAVVSDTTLKATTPQAATSGTVAVVVTTPTGQSAPFRSFTYAPTDPPPSSDRAARSIVPSPTTGLPAPRRIPFRRTVESHTARVSLRAIRW